MLWKIGFVMVAMFVVSEYIFSKLVVLMLQGIVYDHKNLLRKLLRDTNTWKQKPLLVSLFILTILQEITGISMVVQFESYSKLYQQMEGFFAEKG